MFNTIEDVKRANKAAGLHWFEEGAMAFFDSIIYPELIQHPEGAYFISSGRFDSRSPRLFTVRFANLEGRVNSVSEFQGFNTQEDAWQWALDHKDAWIRSHSEESA